MFAPAPLLPAEEGGRCSILAVIDNVDQARSVRAAPVVKGLDGLTGTACGTSQRSRVFTAMMVVSILVGGSLVHRMLDMDLKLNEQPEYDQRASCKDRTKLVYLLGLPVIEPYGETRVAARGGGDGVAESSETD